MELAPLEIFKDAITRIPNTIVQVYPLIHQKGHKSLILETGTSTKDFHNHINGVMFDADNWKYRWPAEEWSHFPTQLKKLISVGKNSLKTKRRDGNKRKASKVSQDEAAQDCRLQ